MRRLIGRLLCLLGIHGRCVLIVRYYPWEFEIAWCHTYMTDDVVISCSRCKKKIPIYPHTYKTYVVQKNPPDSTHMFNRSGGTNHAAT